MVKKRNLVSECLVHALKNGEPSELRFSKTEFSGHNESPGRKVGYKPILIGKVPIPQELKISYVEAWDDGDRYFYVVSQLSGVQEGGVNQIIVPNRSSAERTILHLLKEFASN